jgi:hypothetical protein
MIIYSPCYDRKGIVVNQVSDSFLFLINCPKYVKIRRFFNLSIEGLTQ